MSTTTTRRDRGFHVSNYGSFSGGIPHDQDGYCYTTQAGWLRAKMDWGNGHDYASKRVRCTELAAEAREAVKSADAALAEWRSENC